jgi:hypothetical protein
VVQGPVSADIHCCAKADPIHDRQFILGLYTVFVGHDNFPARVPGSRNLISHGDQ